MDSASGEFLGPVGGRWQAAVMTTALPKITSDFDFLVGRWSVQHRRLRRPLAGGDDWYELSGPASAQTLFNGAVSVDQIGFPSEGYAGMSVRLYNPASTEWTIYWVNSRDGKLQPPVVGRWAGGILEATGPDTYDGQPIMAMYRWSQVTDRSARWEQSFSTDDGTTWELNWIMDWTRLSGSSEDSAPRESSGSPNAAA